MSFGDVHRYPQIDVKRLHADEDYDDESQNNEAEFNKVKQILTNIQRRNDGNIDGKVEMTLSEQEYLSWVIAEREDLMKRVAQEMRDTRQLMQDISVLVEEQGLWIDSIEANIETSKTQTDKAKDELKKAYAAKKKSRERGCMVAGAAGIGALILALIVGSAVRPH